MNKFFLSALLFVALLINSNNAFSYSDIEYFPGERKPILLDYYQVESCLRISDILKLTQLINIHKYDLDKELIKINEIINADNFAFYEINCSGASYFKEDYDQAVKNVSAGYKEDSFGLFASGYGDTLAKYAVSIIDYKLDFPYIKSNGVNYLVVGSSLLDNKYFVADTSFNEVLGITINNKERIHLSNTILSRLGFHVSKTNMKQKTPDKKAIFAFKLHMLKNSPFVQPASPLYNLDIKTCMLLDYCLEARDSKCFKK